MRLASLWFGVLAGPLTWAGLLETNYVLSYVACDARHSWMLHVSTGLALALIAAGALSAWRVWVTTPAPETLADASAVRVSSNRFIAASALALCAWFALVVLATEIPVVMLHPCTL